jgi:tetratricopeptide (TPR) repeat protein
MPNFRMKILTVSCGLALAGGCALLDRTSQPQRAVVPVSNVTHSAAITDANYQIGRSYQDRLQYDAAIAAYRKSLEANPGNAEAHNALGVIYASQGKHAQAVIELMAALALAPTAAHIHNNLGYSYLLQGRNADALAALKVASELDPDNERSRENIKTAQRRLSNEAPNAPTAPLATAVGAEVKSPAADKDGGHSTARLLSVAPNIFELRQGSSMQVKPRLPLAAKTAPETVRLEVANGNGVTGFAKRTSSSLQRRGYAVTRLTNQVPYTQMISEIQYRRGQENQAKQLRALLSVPAKLVESSRLIPPVGVRLVLGRDAVQQSLFTETQTPHFRIAKL